MAKNNSEVPIAVRDTIERMLKRSQTKILFPVIIPSLQRGRMRFYGIAKAS